MTKPSKNTLDKQLSEPLLCIAAGGSGGHILPALHLARKWLLHHPTGHVIAYCSHKPLDKKILSKQKIVSHIQAIRLTTFNIKKPWRIPLLLAQITYIFFRTCLSFAKNKPIKIISTGGIESLPVCLAAKLFVIPIELYELNVEPGKAISFLAPLATCINIVFDNTRKRLNKYNNKCKLVPYPIRFTKNNKTKSSKKTFDMDLRYPHVKRCDNRQSTSTCAKKTILILGGSQGSHFLNELMRNILLQHGKLAEQLNIIHQIGNNNTAKYRAFYRQHNIKAHVFNFYDKIEKYYQYSDIVLCRAGAGTLFELLFFEKPAIIIPLQTSTTKHQIANAQEIANMRPDLFSVISQQSLKKTTELLSKKLAHILTLKY